VVPPGDESAWTHGAFAGEVKDGLLYGRGAVDMKGGIACKRRGCRWNISPQTAGQPQENGKARSRS